MKAYSGMAMVVYDAWRRYQWWQDGFPELVQLTVTELVQPRTDAFRYVMRYAQKPGLCYWSMRGAQSEVVMCVFCDQLRPASVMASVKLSTCRACLRQYDLKASDSMYSSVDAIKSYRLRQSYEV